MSRVSVRDRDARPRARQDRNTSITMESMVHAAIMMLHIYMQNVTDVTCKVESSSAMCETERRQDCTLVTRLKT